jgi:hypothetical protein
MLSHRGGKEQNMNPLNPEEFNKSLKKIDEMPKMPTHIKMTSDYVKKLPKTTIEQVKSENMNLFESYYAPFFGIPVVIDETVDGWEISYDSSLD